MKRLLGTVGGWLVYVVVWFFTALCGTPGGGD